MTLTVSVLARETLLLRDGDDWMRIRCAWGSDPGFAFLIRANDWDRALPGWLRGRRSEVVRAIEQFGLQVKDDDQPLSPAALGRGEAPDRAKGPIGSVAT